MQVRNWLLILFLILVAYALPILAFGLTIGPVFDGLASGKATYADVTFGFERAVWLFLSAAVAFAMAVVAISLTARLLKCDKIRRVPGFIAIFFGALAGFNAFGCAVFILLLIRK